MVEYIDDLINPFTDFSAKDWDMNEIDQLAKNLFDVDSSFIFGGSLGHTGCLTWYIDLLINDEGHPLTRCYNEDVMVLFKNSYAKVESLINSSALLEHFNG